MKKTRIFKSIFCILLALILVFSFAGCNTDKETQSDTENEKEEEIKSDEENEKEDDDDSVSADLNNSEVLVKTDISDELEFYYLNSFYSIYQTANSYDMQYGEGTGKMFTGYDLSLAPDKQTTKNADGETITFAEYFYEQAIDHIAYVKYCYELAVDAGIKLTAEDKNEIDAELDEFKKSNYFKTVFDVKFSDEFIKSMITYQKYIERYQDSIREQCDDADEIEKIYAEDKTVYDVVSFRWYAFDNSDLAVTEAETFISSVTSVAGYDEETFKKVVLETVGESNEKYEVYKNDQTTKIDKLDKDTIETNVSTDAADWFFETDSSGNYVRQSGDIKYFVSSDKKDIYILYATGIPFRDETKETDVRHILLMDSTYSEAKNVLDEYLAEAGNDVDEEYFIDLVSKHTDDTGSKSTGGLIENMKNDGQYVSAFEDWAFAEGEFAGEKREYGSTGIVKSEYGYHIMFFADCDENPEWYEIILEQKYNAELEKLNTAIDAEELVGKDIDTDTKESVMKKCVEAIGKMQ